MIEIFISQLETGGGGEKAKKREVNKFKSSYGIQFILENKRIQLIHETFITKQKITV